MRVGDTRWCMKCARERGVLTKQEADDIIAAYRFRMKHKDAFESFKAWRSGI
jgi:hypothetical protein